MRFAARLQIVAIPNWVRNQQAVHEPGSIRYNRAMESILKSENKPATVGEALEYCAQALEKSDVFFGHGTDNPWDESVQLVLSIANLAPDSS